MSFNFEKVFPDIEILKGSDRIQVKDALNGKEVVGLYFSAHWCPPCKGFTPILADAYKELEKQKKSFEIVFVSSDQSQEQFDGYYKEMPWLALPYQLRDLKDSLAKEHKCQGIPYLVLLDGKTGEVITTEGRDALGQYGSNAFPFTKEAISKSKEEKLVKKAAIFKDWSLLDGQFDVSQLTSKEAVAIFVGKKEGISGVHVLPVVKKAWEQLKTKLAVVYIPTETEMTETEKNFRAEMPEEWFKLQPNSKALEDLKGALGKIDDPLTMIIKGDGSQVYHEEASRYIYENLTNGFPYSQEAIETYEKEQQDKKEKMKQKMQEPGLKFLDEAKILNKEKQTVSVDELRKCELVGVYFSAHWCPPCRGFTPVFAEEYKKLKQDGRNVEVIFVSSDRDQKAFDDYFAEMPWLALDYEQRNLKSQLAEGFEVEGIPKLVWINVETGKIESNGRSFIEYGAEYYPWTKELLDKAESEKEEKRKKEEADKEAKIKVIQQQQRDAKQVVLVNHVGQGEFTVDYQITFNYFNTLIGDVKLRDGQFYYELEILKDGEYVQFGWITEGFEGIAGGEGVGDDKNSWGFDGYRVLKWNAGETDFGSEWKKGDVIGFAVDLKAKKFSLSVNGSFDQPNGVGFENVDHELKYVQPAFTGCNEGKYRLNFGDRDFKFKVPVESYLSVHQANLAQL